MRQGLANAGYITAVTRTTEHWFIAEWSRETARGTVRSSSGARVPFDAAVSTVSDFFLGEEVRVDLYGSRVVLVEPVHTGEAVPQRLEAEGRVTPTGYLSVREADLDVEVLRRLEDLAFDRLGIASLTSRPHGPGEHDVAGGFILDLPALRPLVEAVLGRPVEELVRVAVDYPFDWKLGTNDLDAYLDRAIAPRLPGFRAPSPYFYASDDAPVDGEEASIPYLGWSIETTGLMVFGVLARTDWTRWRAAFEQLTAHIPMRTY